MSRPITKVELVGFCGAIVAFDVDSDPQKGMTTLLGENSSGESSIADPIDAIADGGIGAVEGINSGRIPSQHLSALGATPVTVKVTVHSGQGSWTGTRQRYAVSVSGLKGTPLSRFFADMRLCCSSWEGLKNGIMHSPVLEVAARFIGISYEKR